MHSKNNDDYDSFNFKTFGEQLSRWDAYPKMLEDFRIKTLGGATVTLISVSLIIIMFIFELNHYLTPYVHEELIIDISSGKKLTINFDITFPHVGCTQLSLDATDVSGEQHINIEHNIFKRRLDDNGDPIELPKKDNSINAKKVVKLPATTTENLVLDPNRCESCYGADSLKHKCCNTCKEVHEAYNAKGWSPPNPLEIEQCKREGVKSMDDQPKEGCQIFGNVEVNKIAGNFHIALGQSFEKNHVHTHDINLSDLFKLNTSHVINHLSFGRKLDNTVNQLDNASFISEEGHGLATFQYYLKIIPTIYQSIDGEEIQTNQFAVTRYKKEFGNTFEILTEARLPGVFFIYEFAPMLVKYSQRLRSFLNFVTTFCGIIGGILTVASIVDSFIYHGAKVLRTKIQIGKFS
ncbi:Endoplasmic reticulum-Golgi intermediate compartment protein 3 [Blomia tropicalis]|nr:Endoplasmic reticulum-Golgi intermediate compartment protein 3 [Blomia tropicalis]